MTKKKEIEKDNNWNKKELMYKIIGSFFISLLSFLDIPYNCTCKNTPK